jgi:hypothetical protein
MKRTEKSLRRSSVGEFVCGKTFDVKQTSKNMREQKTGKKVSSRDLRGNKES